MADDIKLLPLPEKPEVKLLGLYPNIYSFMAIARKKLRDYNMVDKCDELTEKFFNCKSFEEAFLVISEFVTII